jgi:hypothetical protein
MQGEIDAADPPISVRILGVNEAGQESGNPDMCSGRTLPWLQDTRQQNVWGSWRVEFRDVVILDAENRVLRAYNLTTHDLGNPDYYAALKALLLAAAQ